MSAGTHDSRHARAGKGLSGESGDRLVALRHRQYASHAVLGAAAVVGGLYGSLSYDTPSGPSIVVAALALFLISIAVPVQLWRKKRQEA